MPEPKTRIPPLIPIDHYDPRHEGREYRLLSQRAYNYVRSIQLEYCLEYGHPFIGILNKEEHPLLEYSVIVGENDETIALYESAFLGKGSFGHVIVGVSCDTGHFYAVKIQKIPTRFSDLKYEVKALKALNYFIDQLSCSLDNSDMHIAAHTLAWGEDFSSFLGLSNSTRSSRKNLSFRTRVQMAYGATSELMRLFKQGYLHRDIKLNNMMWDDETNTCQLIDFGFSRPMNKSRVVLDGLIGTELYIAPELILNQDDIIPFNEQSEVYALGLCLLQIFTKQDFDVHSRPLTVLKIQQGHLPGVIEPLVSAAFDVLGNTPESKHPNLYRMIEKMLDNDPTKRPSLKKVEAKLLEKVQSLEKKVKKEPRRETLSLLYRYPAIQKQTEHVQEKTNVKKSSSSLTIPQKKR